jgi:cysteine desulfurase/selenocysteine lyase
LVTPKTKIVSVVHVSNALGTINPVRMLIERAHQVGAKVLLDGAQAVAHMPVDVQALDVDFYAFSGHKLYGPTGIGVLYGKMALLEQMPPYQGGGDMIKSVSFAQTTYAEPPAKFEAGTPDIAGAVGLSAAIDYVRQIGFDVIAEQEAHLLATATSVIADVPRVRLIGTAPEKSAVVSFVMAGIHPHDVGTVLDLDGVAIRTGHHCAQPVMTHYGVPATARASMAFYNTDAEMTRWHRRSTRYSRCLADVRPARAISRGDSRSQQEPVRGLGRPTTPPRAQSLCGDHVKVHALVSDDGVIQDLRFKTRDAPFRRPRRR